MKFYSKKVLAAVLASAMTVSGLGLQAFTSSADSSTRYELESGTVTGTVKTDSGASGGSYVFFENGGEEATVTVDVETTGMYDIYLGYQSPYGNKIEFLMVNGASAGSVSLGSTEWTEVNAATAKLTAGENTIGVQCSWGWVNVDYIRIEAATTPDVVAYDDTLADSQATASTQKLYSFLNSVYGKYVISGQQEYYGNSRDDEFNYIQENTGELPVIRGFDFGDTCPLYAWDDGITDRMIKWSQETGGICTASWHVNVPTEMSTYTQGGTLAWDQTTYSEKTDFVTANCLVEGTDEYEYFGRCVANLAEQLQKLADADVPVLFRPFHEAEGNGGADGSGAWFWWSKEGSEVYVQLYQYLYDQLTNVYGLHNLIWEFNSYTYSIDSAKFYPGDDYVDIIGYDKYNATNWTTNTTSPNLSAISSTFFSLIEMYNSEKMIAMMENDTIPSVENMTEEGAYWLYFMPWYGDHLMNTNYNTVESLKSIYTSDLVMTLDEFKELYAAFDSSDVTTVTRPTTTTTTTDPNATTTTTAKEFQLTKYNLKNLTPGSTLTVTLEGTPGASTGGCFGYVDENDPDASETGWVSKEWSDNYDSDGKITVTFTVPDGVTTGEFQIWWAGLWNAKTESNDYADSAMVDYTCDAATDGTTTTEATTTEETTTEETTTTTVSETEETTTEETTTTTTTETTPVVSDDVTTTTEGTKTEATMLGDTSLDSKVNLADVVLLSKAAAGSLTFTDTQSANADVNGDNTISSSDVTMLSQFLVGAISKLG